MHDIGQDRPNRDRLLQYATEQHGYFTTAQAQKCGFSTALLTHHAGNGQFVRIRRGLYRFRDFPPSRWEDVMAAWLAAGREHAVVSHETALELLNLSDVIADSIHITIPRSRRWYKPSEGVVLHTTRQPPGQDEVVTREGMRATSPARTIVDVADSGLSPEHVEAAVRQAHSRSLATRRQLAEAADARGGRAAELVHNALEREEQS